MSAADVIVCPLSGEELIPQKIWESQLPDGQPVRYGQFEQHFHWGQECEWSYLVQPLPRK